jgi:hypothetical protein
MISIKKKDWIEAVLHIAFWAGVFYMLLSLTVPHIQMRIDNNGTIQEKDIIHPLSAHFFLTLGLLMVLFYGNVLWLLKKALYYKNILIRLILPLVWFFTVWLANNYAAKWLPAKFSRDTVIKVVNKGKLTFEGFAPDPISLQQLPPAGIQKDRFIENRNRIAIPDDGLFDTVALIFIIVFGLSIAYFFLKEWARTEKFRSHLEAVQLDTEIKFLKSQVNPHFLFNTLNNLFSMAQAKGNDELADGISKLSGMMRYMLYDSNAEKVPLDKEIIYLEESITLNKLRYADQEVTVRFDHILQTGDISIAPMLFIPFVENAFKHGVAIGQSSVIIISIALSNQSLFFTCENTNYGSIKKMNIEKSGIGLENVQRRLELLYPGKHRLQINKTDEKYIVNLEINLA